MKLYRENKCYGLSHEEIAAKFISCKKFNNPDSLNHYRLAYLILLFIGDKEGLNSTWDFPNDDIAKIQAILISKNFKKKYPLNGAEK